MGLTSLESRDEFVAANRRNYEAYRAGAAGRRGRGADRLRRRASAATGSTWCSRSTSPPACRATSCKRCSGRRTCWRAATSSPAATAWSPTARCSRTRRERLPETERLVRRVLALPTGTSMDPDAVTLVADLVRRALRDAPLLRAALQRGRRNPMRVSVLMTSFQHERYIARALDGVLEQRGVEFELLVGDDASTDGTREVISEYARAHPDVIRTFLPERNLGQGGQGHLRRADRAGARRLPRRARRRRLLDVARQAAAARSPTWTSIRSARCAFTTFSASTRTNRARTSAYNGADQPAEVDVSALLGPLRRGLVLAALPARRASPRCRPGTSSCPGATGRLLPGRRARRAALPART